MEITSVFVNIPEYMTRDSRYNRDSRCKGYANVVFDDCFAVHDIKIVEAENGSLFVSMPDRKVSDKCDVCRMKNHVRAKYCNDCGSRLRDNRALLKECGRPDLYVDIAHPVTQTCRKWLENIIIAEYRAVCADNEIEQHAQERDW